MYIYYIYTYLASNIFHDLCFSELSSRSSHHIRHWYLSSFFIFHPAAPNYLSVYIYMRVYICISCEDEIMRTHGITAVSRISGCARSIASNSAGATCMYKIYTFKHWKLFSCTIFFVLFLTSFFFLFNIC